MRDPSTAAMVAELPLRDVFFNMDPMHEEKVNTFDNNLPDISTVRKLVFLIISSGHGQTVEGSHHAAVARCGQLFHQRRELKRLVSQKTRKNTHTQFFSYKKKQLTDHLFGPAGLDLAAFNMQRGRDHGLQVGKFEMDVLYSHRGTDFFPEGGRMPQKVKYPPKWL